MSSADIQISNTPNLAKIESFLKNSLYTEVIEFSANFNKTLSVERRHRLPFLDPQTNVAQNHSNLFMSERQRMPGFRKGQIYSYPSNRWKKSRRQYLEKFYRRMTAVHIERPFQTFKKESSEIILAAPIEELNGALFEDTSLGGTGDNTSDSNSNQQQLMQQQQQPQTTTPIKEDWYYDDVDVNDIDSLEEPKSPADDEYDYDPRYGNKKRRKRRPGKKALMQMTGGEPRKSSSRNSSGSGGNFSSVSVKKSRGGRRNPREPSLASLRNSLVNAPSPEPLNEPVSFETALGDVYRL
ncbi:hypothetical protein ACFFRR_003292 [Megaselia abdita]